MSLALYDLGREDESEAALQRVRKLDDEFVAEHEEALGDTGVTSWPKGFAIAYAWTENSDEAFRYLRLAAEQDGGIQDNLAMDPRFTRLHDDPRWLPFLREFGRTPEQLAEIRFNPRLPGDLPRGN
jgi:hypothetical protein